jgi:hypothetical protein
MAQLGSTSQTGAMPIRCVVPNVLGRYQTIMVNGTAYPTRRTRLLKTPIGDERWLLEAVKPNGVTGDIELVQYNSAEAIGAAPTLPTGDFNFVVTVGGVDHTARINISGGLPPNFAVVTNDAYGYTFSGGETLKDPDGSEVCGAIRWFLRVYYGCPAWELDVVWTHGVIARPGPHVRASSVELRGAYAADINLTLPEPFASSAILETAPSFGSSVWTLEAANRTLEQFGRHEYRCIVTPDSPSTPEQQAATAIASREGMVVVRGNEEQMGWHKNPYITSIGLPRLLSGGSYRNLSTDLSTDVTEVASERAASPAATWRVAHRNAGKGGGVTGGSYLERQSFAEAVISVTEGGQDHKDLNRLLLARQWRQSCRRQGLIYDEAGRPLDVGAYVAEFGAVEWFLNPATSTDFCFSASDKRDWDAVQPYGTSPTGTANAGEAYQLSYATIDNQHAPRALHEAVVLCELWADDLARHYLGGRAASCRLESFEAAANPANPSQFREKLAWELKQAQDDPGTGIGFNRDEGWRCHTIAMAVRYLAASPAQYQAWATAMMDGVVIGQTPQGHIGVTNTGKAAEDVSGSGASAPYRYASRPWNSGFIIIGLFELLECGALPWSRKDEALTAARGVAAQHRWAWLASKDAPSFSLAVADPNKNFYPTQGDIPADGFQANPLYSTNPADYEGDGFYYPDFVGTMGMYLWRMGTLRDLHKLLEGYIDWKDDDAEHDAFAYQDFSGAITQEWGNKSALMSLAQRFPRSVWTQLEAYAESQDV